METQRIPIELLLRRQDVLPYMKQIVEAAESDRVALGWFPFKIYEEAAFSERLILAITREANKSRYVGHLLFATSFPRGHVMQIHVDSDHRGHRIVTRLLDELKLQLSTLNYISIRARVAEDLHASQKFWESQGFYAYDTTPGGKTRGRTLVLRSYELSTQQLFASSGQSRRDPLGLAVEPSTADKLYLLDLNVIFDLGPRRVRHQDVIDLFAQERIGMYHLALSTEYDAELKRSAMSGKTDPMQGWGQIFPKFAVPPDEFMVNFIQNIAPIVFPKRFVADALTASDLSDLRHLATAVHHKLAGLVTSDSAIRKASAILRSDYGIEVLSPSAFKILSELDTGFNAITTSARNTLELVELMPGREASVRELLDSLGVAVADQSTLWAAGDGSSRAHHRYVVLEDQHTIGYLMLRSSFKTHFCDSFLAVDERVTCTQDAARLMLVRLLGLAKEEIQHIRLNLAPQQVSVREIALEIGFTGTNTTQKLNKISIHSVLLPHNWLALQSKLQAVSNITLPPSIPVFRDINQYMELTRPDGQRTQVTTFALETMLSPALICMPGRPGILVPIQRDYAEHLLDHLHQMQLLPQAKALLYQQRHYLSSPKTLKVFQRGSLIFFYESARNKGLKAVVAVARVINAYLSSEEMIDKNYLDRSALEASDLAMIGKSKIKTVVAFDNLMKTLQPVPLESLKKFGCGKATQLLTSRTLTSDQIENILLEGFPYEHLA